MAWHLNWCYWNGKFRDLLTWLSSTNRVAIMHLGTNDCWGTNRMTDDIMGLQNSLDRCARISCHENYGSKNNTYVSKWWW